MKNKGTLILSGLGLNCESETAYACTRSGASKVDVKHTLSLLNGDIHLKDYDFLIFIGGFLDGDYLGSGRVGANRIRYSSNQHGEIKNHLDEFSKAGKLILGICNGFQLMVKLGLLPFEDMETGRQSVSLTDNAQGIFEDRWVHLKVNSASNNIFTKNIDQLYLPIRHGEGQLVLANPSVGEAIKQDHLDVLYYADSNGNSTDRYPLNPNGSWNQTAGLGNKQGNIFGLMPHPEAYNHYTNHPNWTRLKKAPSTEKGEGLKLFENAYKYLQA